MEHQRRVCRAVTFAVAMFCALPTKAALAAEPRSFQSGGRTIHVDFYPPVTKRNIHRAVIVLHGAGGMIFDGPEMRRMARRLAREGYSVYLLHYFNRTGSLFFARDAGMEKNFDVWLATVREATHWVRHEQAERGDERQAVGIYGYSLGAFLALAASSGNPNVAAVAEQAGGVWNNDAQRIHRLPPTLLIHGRADQRVPFAKYAEPLMKLLRERGTSFETRFYEGEAHGFSPSAQAKVREQVAEFFHGRLR